MRIGNIEAHKRDIVIGINLQTNSIANLNGLR